MADEVRWIIRAVDATKGAVNSSIRNLGKIASAGARAGRAVFNAFRGIGNFIGTQFRRAGLAIAGLSIYSIKLAADAEESASKFQVVFGDAAGRVTEEISAFAQAVNRSSDEMQFLAADIGDMVKAMGLNEQAAADLSIELVKLATDTASFKNAQVPDVVLAFTSALAGERESLKRLGAYFSEDELKAELLKGSTEKLSKATENLSGIQAFAAASLDKTSKAAKKTTKDFTQAEKITATMAILTRKLSDGQGDAERTSGSLTNTWKGLVDTVRDAGREYGNQLAQGFKLAEMFGMLRTRIAAMIDKLKDSKAVQNFAAKARDSLIEVVELIERVSMGGADGNAAAKEIGDKLKAGFRTAAGVIKDVLMEDAPAIGKAIGEAIMAAFPELRKAIEDTKKAGQKTAAISPLSALLQIWRNRSAAEEAKNPAAKLPEAPTTKKSRIRITTAELQKMDDALDQLNIDKATKAITAANKATAETIKPTMPTAGPSKIGQVVPFLNIGAESMRVPATPSLAQAGQAMPTPGSNQAPMHVVVDNSQDLKDEVK